MRQPAQPPESCYGQLVLEDLLNLADLFLDLAGCLLVGAFILQTRQAGA
jgi:hypothetical protein